MNTDRWGDLLTDRLALEVDADSWDALPGVAFVYADTERADAVPVWVPDDVWLGAGSPMHVLMILAAAVTATGMVPLIRPPVIRECVGVALWSNVWADEDADRAEAKVALFVHLDLERWRMVIRNRDSGAVEFPSPVPDEYLPLFDALRLVASAASSVRWELP